MSFKEAWDLRLYGLVHNPVDIIVGIILTGLPALVAAYWCWSLWPLVVPTAFIAWLVYLRKAEQKRQAEFDKKLANKAE